MKKTIFVLFFLTSCTSTGIAQIVEEEIQKTERTQDTSSTKSTEKKDAVDESKAEDTKLRQMAKDRATFLQKELKLNNYASRVVQKIIYDFSLKANKIIQSEFPQSEKTKSLINLIYFQNVKLKEIMTVEQFYGYVNLKM